MKGVPVTFSLLLDDVPLFVLISLKLLNVFALLRLMLGLGQLGVAARIAFCFVQEALLRLDAHGIDATV